MKKYILGVLSPWGNVSRSPEMSKDTVLKEADFADKAGLEWTIYDADTGLEVSL